MKRSTGTSGRAGVQWSLLAAIVIFYGSGPAGAAKPPSDKGDHVATGGDLAFMNDAAPGGMAEVGLGHLAVERAASPEVRNFAQQMIVDHTKAGEKLQLLAEQKKVKLSPDILPKAKQTKEMLEKLKGAEFDRAYVAAMVEAHEKDVAAFNAVAKNATDADVKAFAAKTAPTLEHHLQMIRALAKNMHLETK